MNTYKIYVKCNGRWFWITVQGRDIYHAKDTARSMYGNDIAFYQSTIVK